MEFYSFRSNRYDDLWGGLMDGSRGCMGQGRHDFEPLQSGWGGSLRMCPAGRPQPSQSHWAFKVQWLDAVLQPFLSAQPRNCSTWLLSVSWGPSCRVRPREAAWGRVSFFVSSYSRPGHALGRTGMKCLHCPLIGGKSGPLLLPTVPIGWVFGFATCFVDFMLSCHTLYVSMNCL